MRTKFPAIVVAGLLSAQLNPPGGYNLGMPQTPGARVPESNPGTAVIPPRAPTPSGQPAPGNALTAPSGSSAPAGPAYSFGAAPPPVVAPGR
jgi:hypothetical protein